MSSRHHTGKTEIWVLWRKHKGQRGWNHREDQSTSNTLSSSGHRASWIFPVHNWCFLQGFPLIKPRVDSLPCICFLGDLDYHQRPQGSGLWHLRRDVQEAKAVSPANFLGRTFQQKKKKSLHFPVLLRDSRSVSVPGGTMASRDGKEGNGALSEKEKESSCNAWSRRTVSSNWGFKMIFPAALG